MDMDPETTSTTTNNETLIAQGIAFLRSIRGRPGNNRDVLSGRIEALEKSGFKPAEITEVLKRFSEDSGSLSNGNEFVNPGNRPGWYLNSVLPAVLVLGIGAVALYLTGGEDEDTTTAALKNENELMTIDARTDRRRSSRDGTVATEGHYNRRSDEEDYNGDRALHEPYDDYDGGYYDLDHDHDHRVRDQHRIKQAEPDWAKELMRITATIADDVHNIKQKLLQSNDDTTAAGGGEGTDNHTVSPSSRSAAGELSSSEAAIAVPVVVPKVTIIAVRDHLLRLRGTLRHMATVAAECNRNNDGSADGESSKPSSSPFQQGCGALLLYVSKVHEHPSVPRYRKIAASNVAFKTLVEPLSGHTQVLAAVGFSRLGGTDGTGGGGSQGQGKNFEWMWGGSPPEPEKDSASALLLTVNGSSNNTGDSSDHPQSPSCLPASEGTEHSTITALTTTTTATTATAVAAAGAPSCLSSSSSSSSSQVAAAKETTGTDHPSSTAAVVASCTPYSRPATDAERATVLSECLRILQIGKDRGAAAVVAEVEELPS